MKSWINEKIENKLKEFQNTKQIYSNLKTFSFAVTLLILEICVQCDLTIINILNACGINITNPVIIVVADILTQWLLFTALYLGLKSFFSKRLTLRWKQFNPENYIHGLWLHIHDKEDVKIGIVNIEQDFYDTKVNAFNIYTDQNDNRTTKWGYIGSSFSPAENTDIKFMGCYFAERTDQANKQGVHIFREFEYSDGKIVKMKGEFGDALRAAHGIVQNASDKTGRILLYKMSDDMRDYLDAISEEHCNITRLRSILSSTDEKIISDPFVIDLRKILYKNRIQKKWSTLKEICSHEIVHNSEQVLIKALVYLAFADGNIDDNELQNLGTITGFSWTRKQVAMCRCIDCNEVVKNVTEFIESFDGNKYAKDLYKEILDSSAELIVFCNANLDEDEESFLIKLKKAISEA